VYVTLSVTYVNDFVTTFFAIKDVARGPPTFGGGDGGVCHSILAWHEHIRPLNGAAAS
jgi:hypothetical protein